MADLTFAWEPLAGLLDDGLSALVTAHHAEVGVFKNEMPLDVDWDGYREDEAKGILRILSARLDEKLIGYNSFFVLFHRHYKRTLHALGDAIYVLPEFRHSGAGPLLVMKAEKDLADFAKPGYARFVYHDKAFLDYLKPMLTKMGYEHQENILSKIVRA